MFQIIQIDESYTNQMLPILEASPIQAGGLKLYFDKSPDIFKISRMKYAASHHLGFFQENELMGFGSIGYYDAMVGGKKEQIFTFYNFYIKPEARGKGLAERALKLFILSTYGKANYGLIVTMKGNRQVESYIGRQVCEWIPKSRVIDELIVKSILFSIPKKNNTIFSVRNASYEDIPIIVQLLNNEHKNRDFGGIYYEDDFQKSLVKRGLEIENYFVALNSKGKIMGVCLAWDCSSFRQTRVIQFSREFYPTLYAYKTLEKIFPMASFPKSGESFQELTITNYAVEDRNPHILNALLSEIYHRNLNRKYHFMNFASCETDPLLNATKGFWHKNITSHLILTSLDTERFNIQTNLPYIDIAFL